MSDNLVCLVCGEPQKSYKGLSRHINLKHSMHPEEYYRKYLMKDENDGVCKQCGGRTQFRSIHLGYTPFCNLKCSNTNKEKNEKIQEIIRNRSDEEKMASIEKLHQTLKEKYGDSNYGLIGSSAYKKRTFNKYGDANYSNHEKAKKTCLERYGVEYVFLTEESRKKSITPEILEKADIARKKTCLERYGVEYVSQSKEVSRKMVESKKQNVNNTEKSINATLFKSLIKDYGQGWLSLDLPKIYVGGNVFISNEYLDTIKAYKDTVHQYTYVSNREKEMVDYIKSLGNFEVKENDVETVKNGNYRYYELDAYIPEMNLAFEFDGMYWHSDIFKDRDYHKRKTDFCKDAGVKLVHVFEDLWMSKRDIYKSIIKSSLGIYDKRIYARKCMVKELSMTDYKNFLNENHIQGAVVSEERLGLYYEGELIQVIGIGNSRFNSGEIELHRMCTKMGVQVVGGFSKLLSHSKYSKIYTYVDRSIFDGKGYYKVGFKDVDVTKPGYVYIKDGIRYSRYQFQKSKLKDKLKTYDENMSEYDNMMTNHYLRVFDSGNLKLVYERR